MLFTFRLFWVCDCLIFLNSSLVIDAGVIPIIWSLLGSRAKYMVISLFIKLKKKKKKKSFEDVESPDN